MSQGDVGFAVMLVIVGEPPPRTKPMGCCLFILYVLFPSPKGYRTLSEEFLASYPQSYNIEMTNNIIKNIHMVT